MHILLSLNAPEKQLRLDTHPVMGVVPVAFERSTQRHKNALQSSQTPAVPPPNLHRISPPLSVARTSPSNCPKAQRICTASGRSRLRAPPPEFRSSGSATYIKSRTSLSVHYHFIFPPAQVEQPPLHLSPPPSPSPWLPSSLLALIPWRSQSARSISPWCVYSSILPRDGLVTDKPCQVHNEKENMRISFHRTSSKSPERVRHRIDSDEKPSGPVCHFLPFSQPF